MLVDPNITFYPNENAFTRIKSGVYVNESLSLAFHMLRENYWDEYFWDDFTLPCYGVVDSPEQFMDKFGDKLESSSNYYTVMFSAVYRDAQPKEGGWRWHKWGQYLGDKKPQCEYLYDEPEIDLVYTFNIIRKTRQVINAEIGRTNMFVLR